MRERERRVGDREKWIKDRRREERGDTDRQT
jgi:hypothetical protein